MGEVQRYREVVERNKEYEKTINIQKVKIGALQDELKDAIKK